jgi:NAD(P)-dependent dehydrogenase (short-subunit alcohol dehydrogenase family)
MTDTQPAGDAFVPDLLRDRVALVTGASSGLGRHFADVLARHGAPVVLAARRMAELERAAAEIASAGGHAHAVTMDVRDAASVDAAVHAAERDAGPIAILVNNSGVAVTKPALLTTDEEWSRVIDTNLTGAFRVARAVGAAMRERKQGGAMVNIASVLSFRVAKQVSAYTASKAGLLRLTEALALELASYGIRVNAIAPGYVETDLNRDFLRSPDGEAIAKRVPMRRFGQAPDLDGALLLLASDAGRYMTGTTITVDGGHSLTAI